MDALQFGYRTVVIKDACRGCRHEGIAEMESRMTKMGGLMVNVADVGRRFFPSDSYYRIGQKFFFVFAES